MPNVLITTVCNRNCPYCFAKKHMNQASNSVHMSMENVAVVADFLQHSEVETFAMLAANPHSTRSSPLSTNMCFSAVSG